MFLLLFRERPCQNQRIDHRDDNQDSEMEQVHYGGNTGFVRAALLSAAVIDFVSPAAEYFR